jgi:hypothetical protein
MKIGMFSQFIKKLVLLLNGEEYRMRVDGGENELDF